MPKRSTRKRRIATRSPARALRRKRTRRSSKSRVGRLGDIHTFKGVLNAGILSGILAATSTHLGGQYIMKLSDFPIIGSADAGLGAVFDFVRLNKCKMEFLPRYNVQGNPVTEGGAGNVVIPTFLTGLDEIPLATAANPGTIAPSWTSQSDEDTGVTEATAFDHARISPDYLRGQQNCKETEIYKKHTVYFTPVFYNTLQFGAGTPTPILDVMRNTKKWINLNFLQQSSGAEVQNTGPDFYGPMYSFSNNLSADTAAQAYYDVKLHYSVSFRRLKGI